MIEMNSIIIINLFCSMDGLFDIDDKKNSRFARSKKKEISQNGTKK